MLVLSLAGCASEPSRFRGEAIAALQRVQGRGGESLFPAEFKSVQEALAKGEALLQDEEDEDAEEYYTLALMKGTLLEKELREEKARRKELAWRAEERKKAELERRAREEAKRLAQDKAQALAQAQKETVEAGHKKGKTQAQALKEHLLVSSYTVKRGESLPLIASQPEVYGDRNLWPLIYRANRDQISDPRHIWPGQVLQVPRNNIGRDDIAEARRYAQERPLH